MKFSTLISLGFSAILTMTIAVAAVGYVSSEKTISSLKKLTTTFQPAQNRLDELVKLIQNANLQFQIFTTSGMIHDVELALAFELLEAHFLEFVGDEIIISPTGQTLRQTIAAIRKDLSQVLAAKINKRNRPQVWKSERAHLENRMIEIRNGINDLASSGDPSVGAKSVTTLLSHAGDLFLEFSNQPVTTVSHVITPLNQADRILNSLRSENREIGSLLFSNESKQQRIAMKRFKAATVLYDDEVKLLASGNSLGEILETANIAKEKAYSSLAQLKMAIEISIKNIQKNEIETGNQRQRVYLIFVVVAVLITILTASVLRGVMNRRVGMLVEGTKRVANGDLEFRLKSDAPDEFEKVSNSINAMVVDLGTTISALIAAEDSARENAAMLQGIFDNTPVCMNLKDISGRYILINKPYEEWFGLSSEEIIGKMAAEFLNIPGRVDPLNDDERVVLETGKPNIREVNVERYDGTFHDRRVIKFPVKGPEDQVTAIGTIAVDLTDHVHLEEQLRRSQRMEAVGKLTAGVSHDFNNLLAVMLGNIELLSDFVGNGERVQHHVGALKRAINRAASLTSRLLAFSRQQLLAPMPTDVAELFANLEDMLERTMGETITIKIETTEDLWVAMVDPSQLDIALLNLVINARDAMPDGGILTIKTSNVVLDEAYAQQRDEVIPGEYIRVEVCDTGTGMASEVQDKVFDPFFTTKEFGTGSGLGLSMVFGFVKQTRGHISIDSTEGEGTTVVFYLPIATQHSLESENEDTPYAAVPEPRTILLVEDDPDVRATTASILKRAGYKTYEAIDGPSALEQLKDLMDADVSVDVLFSDVVMPNNMSGIDLAKECAAKYKNIKVLLTSGYPDKINDQDKFKKLGIDLIAKPYESAELITAIEALEFDQTRK